ncbi:exodeoxyribonuclease VII large subunit [Polyangium mundeleinium]|uniref:Exodeoxyribonuclease 7 large subunit n=1 Tax=Polyangium mundeleinium TaxID=2995306 RepID=A0ABT5EP35_9BACT|nr:exodeoxyribonuclease VII large subunit [Polyangium mundeleinium]MDC0743600.1 exodeoxyribonuclease VII large subunit [Polyangium mundeleinium]
MQRRESGPALSFHEAGGSDEVAGYQPRGSSLEARAAEEEPEVLSVAALDQRLRRAVEHASQDVRVLGEVGGFRLHSSGHAYFTLKDEREDALINCVMYKTAAPRARKLLADGARVVLTGRATVYAPRGQLQFSVSDVRPVGRGALLEALERLKQKLAGEGVFAAERKRALPVDPAVIGVVTSGNGAAIHDIVTVSFRRGAPRILLARATVQGPGAAQSMARALDQLARVPDVEVVILGRGGGSAEDLSAFNDEALVRKVASFPVPVVSAVGHEVDVTLTDLAADARAATPSQAAELLVADRVERRKQLKHLYTRIARATRQAIERRRVVVDRLARSIGSPEDLLAVRQQKLDELTLKLGREMERAASRRKEELSQIERRLAERHPRAVIAVARAAIGPLEVRLVAAERRRIERLRTTLGRHAARLDALSPLGVLARGYAIATTTSGRAVRAAKEVAVGESITVRVHEGALRAEVTAVIDPAEGDGSDG